MAFANVLVIGTALSALLLGGVGHAKTGLTQLCWQPAGYTAPVLAAVRSYVTATDAKTAQLRARVGLLQDSAGSVYLVTDEGVCHRASVALALLKANPDTVNLHPVLTIKAGSLRYVLDDGGTKGGEFRARFVADTSFRVLGSIAD